MGSPSTPQYIPSIVQTSPIMISSNKIKKVKIPYVPFTSIHLTDTQTDTQIHQHVQQ